MRLPKEILEATYGLTIKTRGVEEGGDGSVSAENLLVAYASKSIHFLFFKLFPPNVFFVSWPRLYALGSREPGRSPFSAVHSEGLCKRETSLLPPTPRHVRGIIQ